MAGPEKTKHAAADGRSYVAGAAILLALCALTANILTIVWLHETKIKPLVQDVTLLQEKYNQMEERMVGIQYKENGNHVGLSKRDVIRNTDEVAGQPCSATGPPGPAGAPGPVGPRGMPGVIGPAGVQGPAGRDGSPGPAGSAGPAGRDGRDGVAGVAGTPGAVGEPGPRGNPGHKGESGEPGIQGKAGPAGLRGPPGNSGLPGPTVSPPNVPEIVENIRTEIQNVTGTVYVRWGRKTCPSTADLVYDGVIAGSHYTHTGSGANYQCLPLNPIYDNPNAGQQSPSLMYGSEYQTTTFPPLSAMHDGDPVCAVCRVKSRGTLLMVPARNQCPSQDWTREYFGYLMSAHHTHKRSEYVCVDRNPEARPNSSENLNGALLYPVEGRCEGGTLPCGPYTDGYELTCAVCTI